jgi:hypothetical protein
MNAPAQRIVGSYTFFNELENCPRKAYEVRVARSVQRMESEAARWGNYVHDAMEKRIGDGKPLPPDDEDLVKFEPYALAFEGKGAITEMKLGITRDGHPTRFWGPDCYIAGKVDVTLVLGNHVDITDWKTGKDTYETPFELELHALLLAAKFAPNAFTYTARYAYIGRMDGSRDKIGQTYDVSNVGATWAKVNALMHRAYQYQANGHWPEIPNALCGWCDVVQCRHNKKLAREAKEGR